jgi:hypothetical protein
LKPIKKISKDTYKLLAIRRLKYMKNLCKQSKIESNYSLKNRSIYSLNKYKLNKNVQRLSIKSLKKSNTQRIQKQSRYKLTNQFNTSNTKLDHRKFKLISILPKNSYSINYSNNKKYLAR